MATAEQTQMFQDRIARIQKGGANTAGRLLCGVKETRAPKTRAELKAAQREEAAMQQALRRVTNPKSDAKSSSLAVRILVIPLALICGAVAMLGGRVALFHLFPTGATPRYELPEFLASLLTGVNGEIWAGAGLALLLALCFHLLKPFRMVALATGFMAMMFGEIYLADQYPEVWSTLYAPLPVTTASIAAELPQTL